MKETLKKDISQSRGVEDKPAADNFQQLRSYYRVNFSAPLEWQLLDDLGQELDTHKGAVTDISGGGLAFKADCAATPGDTVHILLTGLPVIEKLDTYARVVRVTPLEFEDENEPPAWQVACELEITNNRTRDRLISSIFEQQRRNIFQTRQDEEEAAMEQKRADALAAALGQV